MPLRALCLDFDGVIADTENHHIAAWQRTFSAMGWEVSDETCSRAMELDDRAFLANVFQERRVSRGDIEGWVRRKQEITRSLLADAPRLYGGIPALIGTLQGKRPVAVVTTTWRENVESVLTSAGLLDRVDFIVAKEDAQNPKPDPEPYRIAVHRFGMEPGEVAAVEDSAGGLSSAISAGLKGIAVGHRKSEGPWCQSATFLPHLRDTAKVLEVLGWD